MYGLPTAIYSSPYLPARTRVRRRSDARFRARAAPPEPAPSAQEQASDTALCDLALDVLHAAQLSDAADAADEAALSATAGAFFTSASGDVSARDELRTPLEVHAAEAALPNTGARSARDHGS